MIPEYATKVGDFWVLKNDGWISKTAVERGTIAVDDTLLNLPELNNLSGHAVDVGAYIGDTTRILLDKGFHVTAFEVMEDAFKCLFYNCPEAICHNVALGNGRWLGLHKGKGGNMGGRTMNTTREVETRTLDSFDLRGVTLLKIDAEGCESMILEGAVELLKQPSLRYVIVEFNPWALKTFGYQPSDVEKHFQGWKSREIYRYGDQNWDVIYSRV